MLPCQAVAGDGDLTEVPDAVIAETADDYAIPPVAVAAAIAYYLDNRRFIDSLLPVNEEAVS